MKKKKIIILGIASLACAISLTSCKGNDTTTNTGSSLTSTVEPIPSTTTSETTTSTTTAPVHDHKWDEGTITKYPTINSEGEKIYRCSGCNELRIEKINKLIDKTNYTLKATLVDGLTGVYETKAVVGANKNDATNPTTIGIPSVAKQNLENTPTYESPAIIQGAAVKYEKKTGPTEYTPIPGAKLEAPYTYFRHQIVEEITKDADGKEYVHKKLSGFDGSYYIIRIDVSDIIKNKTGYLHMRQEDNKALLVAAGMQGGFDTGIASTDTSGNLTTAPTFNETDKQWYNGQTALNIAYNPHGIKKAFPGANGNWYVDCTGYVGLTGTKSAAYSIEDNGKALKDTEGNYINTPYIDVIVLSSSKNVAGADTGATNAPKSDIGLSFYVDDTLDAKPDVVYNPTDTNNATDIANKFFDETKMTADYNATSYTVKGSDLEIDVVTKEDENDASEYWSLTKAISFQDYDSHTIKLICEVPVLEGLEVKSIDENERLVVLDLNSFDIQIANHQQTNAAALTVSNNATLKLTDSSRTSGAELAIGNNASMLVKDKGTIIIDSSCQLEVEYDAASILKPKTATADDVIKKITELPEAANVTENDRTKIEEATYYYEAYMNNGGTQENITNYQKLADCIAKLAPKTELTNGLIVVESGGKIINNGIINIEGLEVKPAQPSTTDPNMEVVRDMKSAALTINEGGILDNNGSMSIKGTLYVFGTLNNYGKYDDLIQGNDPDRGTVNYHKGIQLTWKDDVTVLKEGTTDQYEINKDVTPGCISLGLDSEGKTYANAIINNYGDILLAPGTIKGTGKFNNLTKDNFTGNIYICSVSEAVVPINPPANDPTKTTERRQFSPAYDSKFNEEKNITVAGGHVYSAKVGLDGNGLFTDITDKQELTN